MYGKALIFATKAHAGQKRNNGNNFIIHPIRVSQEVATERQKVIALLHDVLEDTDVKPDEIMDEFGFDVYCAVDLLTHKKGISYKEYINGMLGNKDAVAVKIADICDNLSDSPSDNAIEKSSKALEVLINKP